MLDVQAELNEAFTKKNKISAYLRSLMDERSELLAGVLDDPVQITQRLAQIDAELATGKEVSQAVVARYEDLVRRQKAEKVRGGPNYIVSIAQRAMR